MKSKPPATVEEYLAGVPEPARSTLEKVRAAIRSALPADAVEKISYRIPTFECDGPVAGFAAFANHCSLFVMSGTLLDSFAAELAAYQTSKGTIRFAVDKPLPAALIGKLVKSRLAENKAGKRR